MVQPACQHSSVKLPGYPLTMATMTPFVSGRTLWPRCKPSIQISVYRTLALLQSPQPLTPELLLTSLLNEVAARPEQMVLVLDDYHVINIPAIHKALLFLLDHLPLQLHLISVSRTDPPWPLARWRSQGQLSELRADDLRFTPDEAALFLKEVMGLDLSAAAITALETRTEGWIAGLQLAALSLQGAAMRPVYPRLLRQPPLYVDYLVEEVLNQPAGGRGVFLLQTSILEQMCAPLCDAVVGRGRRRHSQALLEKLEQANLFLIPLDDEGKWYRYHHLFAEVLAASACSRPSPRESRITPTRQRLV